MEDAMAMQKVIVVKQVRSGLAIVSLIRLDEADIWTFPLNVCHVTIGETLDGGVFALAVAEGDRVYNEIVVGKVLREMGGRDRMALCVMAGSQADLLLAHVKSMFGDGHAFEDIVELKGGEGFVMNFHGGDLMKVAGI